MAENQIRILHIRRKGPVWVFSDSTVDLVDEPFVSGIPEILNTLIDPLQDEAWLLFSLNPFPGSHSISYTRPESGGSWYQYIDHEGNEMLGWLCPALFKYFPAAPPRIFFDISLPNDTNNIR